MNFFDFFILKKYNLYIFLNLYFSNKNKKIYHNIKHTFINSLYVYMVANTVLTRCKFLIKRSFLELKNSILFMFSFVIIIIFQEILCTHSKK